MSTEMVAGSGGMARQRGGLGRTAGAGTRRETRRAGLRSRSSGRRGAWTISDAARSALGRSQLFSRIDRQSLMQVAALVEEEPVAQGDVLLSEGDEANNLFVVVAGSGVAQLKLDGGCVSLGTVEPGHVAGWSSLVGGSAYPASVVALTAMNVARMEVGGLRVLMDLQPEIGYSVHRGLCSILHQQYSTALETLRAEI